MSEILGRLEAVRKAYFEGAISEREYLTKVLMLTAAWFNSNPEATAPYPAPRGERA